MASGDLALALSCLSPTPVLLAGPPALPSQSPPLAWVDTDLSACLVGPRPSPRRSSGSTPGSPHSPGWVFIPSRVDAGGPSPPWETLLPQPQFTAGASCS